MKEILKVNNLIKKFPKAGGEIDGMRMRFQSERH